MSKKTVVIVGGGIAGLAAANTLERAGGYEVHMLEGSSRLGGRVQTADFPKVGIPVALGGHYFHGEATNSLYQLARKLEFLVEKDRSILSRSESKDNEDGHGNDSPLSLLSDGTVLNTCSSFRHYTRLFQSAYSKLASIDESTTTSPNSNVYDYVALRYNEEVTADTALSLAVFDCYMSVVGLYFGSTLKNIDLVLLADNEADHEDTTEYPGHPLQRIVNHLAEGLSSNVIHLNSEVVSIQWNQSVGHPVAVQCSNGLRYLADHVILTVSLGVLKEKIEPSMTPFFSPPLPESKQLAIQRLGFGVVCKLIFSLTEPLCDDTRFDEVLLFWKENQMIPKQLSWIKGLSLIQVKDKSGLYTAWLGGENAIAVEKLTNADLKEGLRLVAEMFFKKSVHVDSIICTRWYNDPLYRGSYSYAAAGSTSSDRENLSGPLEGTTPLQLLFAGEATHPTYFSTAQAAYDSGIKEALRIIDLSKSEKVLAKC